MKIDRSILPPGRIGLAVSGGSDSVALAFLLTKGGKKKNAAKRFVILHVDHGFRKESKEEYRFVRSLARRLGIPFKGIHAKVVREKNESLEMAARRVRLAFFEEMSEKLGLDAIATGHHMDDVAETLLMKLRRISLNTIRACSAVGKIRFVRPLLGCRDAELKEYLRKYGEEWREDASNADESIERNRVRHTVIPFLERHLDPKLVEHLYKLSLRKSKVKKYVILGLMLLLSAMSSIAADVPSFTAAEPVWQTGGEREYNLQLCFTGAFDWQGTTPLLLKLASSNPYRVRLNGKFAWYGPARGPKGFFRQDVVTLSPLVGRNTLEIECAGYYCASFYFQKQPSFLQAELVSGDRVLLKTASSDDPTAFTATPASRVREVCRYSHARAFAEAYELPRCTTGKVALSAQTGVKLLPRRVSVPDFFTVADDFKPVAVGPCRFDATKATKVNAFVERPKALNLDAFPKDLLKYNLWDLQQRFLPLAGPVPTDAGPVPKYLVSSERGVAFEAPVNRTGFPMLSVTCKQPGELFLTFDEHPVSGEFKPWRSKVTNMIAWKFTAPGEYEVEAFEPYVLKHVELLATNGEFAVAVPRLRLYRNADSRRASFKSSDPELDELFAAAEENFAQNSVDGFMDCPGRERAGWNCDAYFTARASQLLTGNLRQEDIFLEDFALPPHFDTVERGMIPMCYPSDFADGNYIPSWAMFFVLQLEEYARERGGDRQLVESLRPRVFELVDFLARYRNADGLLENLPRWVFVEWSKAGSLVKGVNYPNNMVWVAMLEAVDRLYGRPELAAAAARARETICRQSYGDGWFRDQALRRADGTLEVRGESTETCQYYAFHFGVATKARYPELYRRLVTEFGPQRTASGAWPKIWPSAPFIGNFLRLDWLGREGEVRRQFGELKGYFGLMAKQTGTLWENVNSSDNGSCCHGFASHVAVFIIRDVVGLKSIDRDSGQVQLSPSKEVPLDWCELRLPVKDRLLIVGWRREGDSLIKQVRFE